MIVTEFPNKDPVLEVEKLKYSLGEKIRANCTSRPSYPAANLTWFVNGQQVAGSRQATVQQLTDGLETARTSLGLEAWSGLFRDGRLKLRCLATLFTLYRRSQEAELAEDTPQLAPVMGPTAPHGPDAAARARHSPRFFATICLSAVVLVTCR